MNRIRTLAVPWSLGIFLFFAGVAGAQQKCPVPAAITASPAPNIFTPQQEVDLGDIEAEGLERTRHPALLARLASIHDTTNAWVLEALDARTGTEIGALVIDTGKGSFRIDRACAAGDWVIVADTDGRTLVYSLGKGEQKGAFSGTEAMLSSPADMLVIENEPGRIDVYGIPSFEKRGVSSPFPHRLHFGISVLMASGCSY